MDHCKLGDFGLALHDESQASSSLAEHATVAGTFRYSPPEVLNGDQLAFSGLKKADIYSATIVIAELLTGKEPFQGLNPHQIRRLVTSGERPLIKTGREQGAISVVRPLLEMGWAEKPSERPSAAIMLDEFKSIEPEWLSQVKASNSVLF
jgi:serine/threonine protein kinase